MKDLVGTFSTFCAFVLPLLELWGLLYVFCVAVLLLFFGELLFLAPMKVFTGLGWVLFFFVSCWFLLSDRCKSVRYDVQLFCSRNSSSKESWWCKKWMFAWKVEWADRRSKWRWIKINLGHEGCQNLARKEGFWILNVHICYQTLFPLSWKHARPGGYIYNLWIPLIMQCTYAMPKYLLIG